MLKNIAKLYLRRTGSRNRKSILFLLPFKLEACYWRCVHVLAQYTIMAVTSGTAEIGYLVANLPEFTYLSKYLHFLRGTHIHFQLAVGIRILCAKLASVDARLYRYAPRELDSLPYLWTVTRLHRKLTKSRFDASRQSQLRCNRDIRIKNSRDRNCTKLQMTFLLFLPLPEISLKNE